MLLALITTIRKPGKPPDLVTKYRPISRLKCDIIFFLTNSILPSLIHPDQVGFLAKNQAKDSTRRILNLIQLATLSHRDSLLLPTKFGFWDYIFNYILSLYTALSASVLALGFQCSYFNISKGTRQGCPLYPIVFALYIESLAARICSSPDIFGITVGQADDIIMICSSPVSSLIALLQVIDEYSSVSYCTLNKSTLRLLYTRAISGLWKNISCNCKNESLSVVVGKCKCVFHQLPQCNGKGNKPPKP